MLEMWSSFICPIMNSKWDVPVNFPAMIIVAKMITVNSIITKIIKIF